MRIKTVDDMIEALGGRPRVSELFGCVPSAVSNWKHDGYFPPETYWLMKQEAKRAKASISPQTERKLWNWAQLGGKRNGRAAA